MRPRVLVEIIRIYNVAGTNTVNGRVSVAFLRLDPLNEVEVDRQAPRVPNQLDRSWLVNPVSCFSQHQPRPWDRRRPYREYPILSMISAVRLRSIQLEFITVHATFVAHAILFLRLFPAGCASAKSSRKYIDISRTGHASRRF